MQDVKRFLGFPILILAAVALILLLSVVDVDAQELANTNHEFDLLVEVIANEVGFETPNEQVWFTAEPAPFYDDFNLFEDGSYKFMDFKGCLSGWDCDWPDRYEVADCRLMNQTRNEYFLSDFEDSRQFEYYCTFTETWEDGSYHSVDYPLDILMLRQSWDGDGGPTLEVSLYANRGEFVFIPLIEY